MKSMPRTTSCKAGTQHQSLDVKFAGIFINPVKNMLQRNIPNMGFAAMRRNINDSVVKLLPTQALQR